MGGTTALIWIDDDVYLNSLGQRWIMRVLIAVHGYPPQHNGGAERRAERTARTLAARGHQVRVVCVETNNAQNPDLQYSDSWQDSVLVRRYRFNGGLNPDPFRWSYDHPALSAAVGVLLDQWQPEIMHLFSGYLMGAGTLDAAADRGVQVVVDLTDYWWHCHRINLLTPLNERCEQPGVSQCARCLAEQYRRFRLPAQLAPGLARWAWSKVQPGTPFAEVLSLPAQELRQERLRAALARAATLIAPSQYLANFYISRGVDRERIRVWRQGVECDGVLPHRVDQVLRVGCLGQVKPHKGVDLLLKAWGKLRGARPRRLVIYGSAEGNKVYGRAISREAQRLPDVIWAGAYYGGETWEVLANLDLVVLPSRWVENSPNSILEAQAAGVPIIGSNIGGVAELIKHDDNGLLFIVDDVDDLVRNLQRVIDEPKLLGRMRSNAPEVQSHNAVMDRLEQHYYELVASAAGQPSSTNVEARVINRM